VIVGLLPVPLNFVTVAVVVTALVRGLLED
jgi:hypothetical protein